MRPIFHRHYRPLNPFKSPLISLSLSPKLKPPKPKPFSLSLSRSKKKKTLSRSLSLKLSKLVPIVPIQNQPWLRKPEKKRPSSRYTRRSLFVSTTAVSPVILPPTTCAKTASTPRIHQQQQPPPQQTQTHLQQQQILHRQPNQRWPVQQRCLLLRRTSCWRFIIDLVRVRSDLVLLRRCRARTLLRRRRRRRIGLDRRGSVSDSDRRWRERWTGASVAGGR